MSRQFNNNQRDRKTEGPKRDGASHEARSRNGKENKPDDSRKANTRQTSGLNRNSLNDLYERSSL